MTSLDRKILYLFIGLIVVTGLGAWVFLNFIAPTGVRASIEVENKRVDTVKLDPEEGQRTISIQGRLGESLIGVEQGRIYMMESACPDKVCIHMGAISRGGQVIVCLPNRVVIRILGGDEK